MSAREIIEQIKALPSTERAEVARFVLEHGDWVPEDFRAAIEDVAAGRVVDLEQALVETPPARRDHSAFLNSYAPEDEGLYDNASAR